MPLSNSIQVSLSQSDFNSNKPSFSIDETFPTNFNFANITKTIGFETTEYGYLVFEISYTGNIDYLSVVFTDPLGSEVSSSDKIDGIYGITNDIQTTAQIIKNENNNNFFKTYYVVVNGDNNKKTKFIDVKIAAGKLGTPPTNCIIDISYNCLIPLYSYETGIHVYSAYDSINDSKLNTKLYSMTPIEQWGLNTILYSTPRLNFPALPYYYGYDDKVYKVGTELDRAFGTTEKMFISKKTFGKPKTWTETVGPQSFLISKKEDLNNPNSPNINLSPSCVVPFIDDSGKITEIINSNELTQPLQYRYYLGFDDTNERKSNDSVFSFFHLNTRKQYPITGAQHALLKVGNGIVKGIIKDIKINPYALAGSIGTLGLLYSWVGTAKYFKFAKSLPYIIKGLFGPNSPLYGVFKSLLSGTTFLSPILPYLGAILLTYVVIKLIFKKTVTTIEEECLNFTHYYTNTPYIELGTELYKDTTLTIRNQGYYCDGVYFYYQDNNSITNKTLSSTIAIINEDPIELEHQFSLKADDPILVNDFYKLVVLSYLSGKPLPYCGGTTIYYNDEISQTIDYDCCGLQNCDTVILSVPSETFYSCFSKQDADNKATKLLSQMVERALESENYGTPLNEEDLGELDTYFTHELKIEQTPNQVTVFYDKRTPGLIGKTLYFDALGCFPVLNGYYSVNDSTNYRIFYQTSYGVITEEFIMQNVNSTLTTNGQVIKQNNLDFTSNWFYYSQSDLSIVSAISLILNNDTQPNSLYSDSNLKAGFVKSVGDEQEMFIYSNITTGTYYDAQSGWYNYMIDWLDLDYFYYEGVTDPVIPPTCNDIVGGFYGVGSSENLKQLTCSSSNLYTFRVLGDICDFCGDDTITLVIDQLSGIGILDYFYISHNGFVKLFRRFSEDVLVDGEFVPIAFSQGFCELCSLLPSQTPTPTLSPTPTLTPCNIDENVTISSSTNIGSNYFTANGNVLINTGATTKGFVYSSTTGTPVLGGVGVESVTAFDANMGTYSINITSLSACTTYYIRAYVRNPSTNITCYSSTITTTTIGCTPTYQIYLSGMSASCDTFCSINYNINVISDSSNNYNAIGVGDYIYNITEEGYYAISDVMSSTFSGSFRIIQVMQTGEVVSVAICSGGTCSPL